MSVKTNESLEDYNPPDESTKIPLSHGSFYQIKSKSGQTYLCKVIENSDKVLTKIIDNEKNAGLISSRFCSLISPLKSIFQKEDKYYFIYNLPSGQNLMHCSGFSEEDIKYIARQFYLFILKANARKLYINKENPLENIFISSSKKITYVGLDTASYDGDCEKFSEASKISPNPDYITFAGFYHQLLTGKDLYVNGSPSIDSSITGDNKTLIEKCLSEENRKAKIDLLSDPVLEEIAEVKFDKDKKRLEIGKLGFDFSNGICLAVGDSKFQFENGNITISGNGCNTTIGAAGLNMSAGSDTISVGKDGLKLQTRYGKSEIGPGGFKSTGEGEIYLGDTPEGKGFKFAASNGHYIKFINKLDFKLGTEAKVSIGFNSSLQDGSLFFSIGTDGLNLINGASMFHCTSALSFSNGPASFTLSSSGLDLLIENKSSLSIGGEGMTGFFGDLYLNISSSGLLFESDGITAEIGTNGASFKNGSVPIDISNVDFDFAEIAKTIKLPKIDLPAVPKPPSPLPQCDICGVSCNVF